MTSSAPGAPAAVVRVTKRRAETRRRLLDAALDAFAEQGLGRTTIEDVTGRAGFTRGAFYSNFTSLEELFFALYQDRADRLVAATTAVLEPATAARGLDAVVDLLLAALPDDRQWFLVSTEFIAHALRTPELLAAMVERRRALRGALLPALRGIVRSVEPARADDAAAMDRLVRAVAAVHEGMSAQIHLEPGETQLPDLRRQLLLASLGVLDDPAAA